MTRYAAQTGHYVERRFGWDCHGLPVEYEIDKKLGAHRLHFARHNVLSIHALIVAGIRLHALELQLDGVRN